MKKTEILNELIKEIATLTGGAATEAQAIELGLNKYLTFEFSSHYGGYRLINVNVNSGGHSSTLLGSSTMERQPFKVFELMLKSLISGLRYNLAKNS